MRNLGKSGFNLELKGKFRIIVVKQVKKVKFLWIKDFWKEEIQGGKLGEGEFGKK